MAEKMPSSLAQAAVYRATRACYATSKTVCCSCTYSLKGTTAKRPVQLAALALARRSLRYVISVRVSSGSILPTGELL